MKNRNFIIVCSYGSGYRKYQQETRCRKYGQQSDPYPDSNLIRILTDLFDEKKSSSEKADIPENQYGIKITDEIEKEVGSMTSYAANLIKKGRAEGRAEFLQKLLESKQPKELILGLGFTENEYQEAKKVFSEKAAASKQE